MIFGMRRSDNKFPMCCVVICSFTVVYKCCMNTVQCIYYMWSVTTHNVSIIIEMLFTNICIVISTSSDNNLLINASTPHMLYTRASSWSHSFWHIIIYLLQLLLLILSNITSYKARFIIKFCFFRLQRVVSRLREKGKPSAAPSDETAHICSQFMQHHLQHCTNSLERIHKLVYSQSMNMYTNIFLLIVNCLSWNSVTV